MVNEEGGGHEVHECNALLTCTVEISVLDPALPPAIQCDARLTFGYSESIRCTDSPDHPGSHRGVAYTKQGSGFVILW